MDIRNGVIRSIVLRNPYLKVRLGISDAELLCLDGEAQLLMLLVGIDICIPANIGSDLYLRLDNVETRGENGLIRIIFEVNTKYIIPRNFELDIFVGQVEAIIGIGSCRSHRIGEIVDSQALETVQILDWRERRRPPIGITMDDGIGITAVVRQHIVKREQ